MNILPDYLKSNSILAEGEGVEPPTPITSVAVFKTVERTNAQSFHDNATKIDKVFIVLLLFVWI